MTKTYTGLFEKLISFDRLYESWRKARIGKRSNIHALIFERDLEVNLIQIQNELIWGEYKTGGYHSFYVYEPKSRKITALKEFRDRVVQQAVFSILEEIWEPRFISDSYACRTSKGVHAAATKAQNMLKQCLLKHGKVCALKADISKFFASIDHSELKRIIRKKIKDEKFLAVVDEIIDSYRENSTKNIGIPIGNLTSQIFANIYLNELDQWVKCRRMEKYYARYMDDFIVIHHDKSHLKMLLLDIQAFLWQNLKLSTNSKTQVFPVSVSNGRGLDFVGFHLWPHKRRIRKASALRALRSIKGIINKHKAGRIDDMGAKTRIVSILNHARHGGADKLIAKALKNQKRADK